MPDLTKQQFLDMFRLWETRKLDQLRAELARERAHLTKLDRERHDLIIMREFMPPQYSLMRRPSQAARHHALKAPEPVERILVASLGTISCDRTASAPSLSAPRVMRLPKL